VTEGWGVAFSAALQLALEVLGLKKKADLDKDKDKQDAQNAVAGKTKPPPKEG
jgi:hypothetical protein